MGIFTDISAALSFNFGDSSKLPEEHYAHVQREDRTKAQLHFLRFLDEKFGIRCNTIERLVDIINDYTDDYENIPFDKIEQERYCDMDDLIEAADAAIEYRKILNREGRTKEELHFLEFLDKKFGPGSSLFYESVIVDYDELLNDYGYDRGYDHLNMPPSDLCDSRLPRDRNDLVKAVNAFLEYKEYKKDSQNMTSGSQDPEETKICSSEERSIREIKESLDFLEKNVRGELTEKEKSELMDNIEKWRSDIELLRTYIERETKNG